MAIRSKVSTILDMPIRDGQYMAYARILDAQGAFSKRVLQDMVLALCEEMESLEQSIDSLKLSLSELKSVPASVEMPSKTADTPSSDILHHCPNCEKSFSTKIALIGHSKSHATA